MGGKKHFCQPCGLSFFDKSTLNKHIKRKHTKKNVEPVLDCNQCDMKFINLKDQSDHIKLHQKDKIVRSPFPKRRKFGFDTIVYTKSFAPRKDQDLFSCFSEYKLKIQEILFEKLQHSSIKMRYTYKIQLIKHLPSGEVEKDFFFATSTVQPLHNIIEFDDIYASSNERIFNQFSTFNENGSGWIFNSGKK